MHDQQITSVYRVILGYYKCWQTLTDLITIQLAEFHGFTPSIFISHMGGEVQIKGFGDIRDFLHTMHFIVHKSPTPTEKGAIISNNDMSTR